MKSAILVGLISVLLFSLTNCRDLSANESPRRRRDDPKGEVELPEEVMEDDFFDFKNCKPSVDAPDNTVDIITDTIIPNQNPLRNARRCLKERLDRAHKKICDAREALEKQREQAQDGATRQRVENQIYRLDQIQWRFNQQLNQLANAMDENRLKLERRVDKKNNFLINFLGYFGDQEMAAWVNITDIESYTECHSESESQRRRDRI